MGSDEDRTWRLLQVWRHTVGSSFNAAAKTNVIGGSVEICLMKQIDV